MRKSLQVLANIQSVLVSDICEKKKQHEYQYQNGEMLYVKLEPSPFLGRYVFIIFRDFIFKKLRKL